jgi:hypothetical protein
MELILKIPNSIFKSLYVNESFLIIFKQLMEGIEKSIRGMSSISLSFLSKSNRFNFGRNWFLGEIWNIYLIFHQIFPREEVVHFLTISTSVCADQSDRFLTLIRSVWLVYKRARASRALQNSSTLCFSLFHEQDSIPSPSPWWFEISSIESFLQVGIWCSQSL